MAEAVDSVIANLEVRLNNYVTDLDRASAAHERFTRTRPDNQQQFSTAEVERYAARHRQAANDIASSEEQTTQRVTRARRSRSEAERSADQADVAAARASANARVETEEQAQARISAAVARGESQRASSRASGAALGAEAGSRATVAAQTAAMSSTVLGSGTVRAPVNAAEREINHELLDRVDLQQRLRYATRDEANELRDQLNYLRQIDGYRRAGLTEEEALARVEREQVVLDQQRARALAEQQALLERQMRAQSAKIGSSIGSGAGLLIGGIGVAELSHLNDEYIRFSNSLKVAGVTSADFEAVQARLLATSTKNGVSIGALSDTYRSIALASHDLGASQADILKVTDAVAQSLRITGASGGAARAAILQLGHAFETGRVTAREFNGLQLNAYPLLQAVAAGSDKYAGSVTRLRAALLAGDLSSKEFFDSLLRGSHVLEDRAAKASLTTAQGFTALNNALIVYIGSTDQANGVSAAVGAGLGALARNLDILIPAIAAVGVALTTGYVVRMTEAAIATRGLGASVLGAFGGTVGLAITAVGLAVAGTAIEINSAAVAAQQAHERLKDLTDQFGSAGRSADAAAGGVAKVGTDALGAIPHVNAFAGAVGNLADQLYRQARAARTAAIESTRQQLQAGEDKAAALYNNTSAGTRQQFNSAAGLFGRGNISGGVSALFGSSKRAIGNLFSGGQEFVDNDQAYADQVEGNRILGRRFRSLLKNPITASDLPEAGGGSVNPRNARALGNAERRLEGLRKLAGSASGKRLERINGEIAKTEKIVADIQSGVDPSAARFAEGGGRGRAGPSAETLARRAEAARLSGVRQDEAYNSALKAAQTKDLEAQADLTNSAETRARLARQRINDAAEEDRRNIRLKGPKDANVVGDDGKAVLDGNGKPVRGTGEYNQAEVTRLLALNASTRGTLIAGVDLGERRRLAEEAAQVDRAGLEARRDELQGQQQLATTLADRRRVANQLLDIEFELRERAAREVLAPDSKASAADRTIAQAAIDRLPRERAQAQARTDREYEGSGAAYRRGLHVDRAELVDDAKVRALDTFNRGLDDSVSKALHLHGIFGDIINDLIQMAIKQALVRPIADALFGGGQTGSAGGIGGLFGSLFGKGGSAVTGSYGTTADIIGSPDTSLLGFAEGGSALIGGRPGRDQNTLSINGRPALRVGRGELLTITPPNVAAANGRVTATTNMTTVIAPQHYDLSGVVMTEDLVRGLREDNRRYADQVASQAGASAVQTAGRQAPAVLRRQQVLGT